MAGRRRVLRSSSFGVPVFVALLGLLGFTPAPAAAATLKRIGTVTPLPSGARATGGAPSASTPLRLTIALQPQDPAGLAAMATTVSTPGSPSFRHYLTVDQFATRFGATPAAVSEVESTLRAGGLAVDSLSPNRLTLSVAGTAGTVQQALHTSLAQVRLANGRLAFDNVEAPALPLSAARYVQGILGLDTVAISHAGAIESPRVANHSGSLKPAKPSNAVANAIGAGPAPCAAASTAQASLEQSFHAYSYTADQAASAYGLESYYTDGDVGAGQTIALVEQEPYFASDISAYQSCYGTTGAVTSINIDGGPSATSDNDDIEAALDIEQLMGLAPKANILVYQGPVNLPQSGADIVTAIVSQDQAKVISTSWGSCEPFSDQSAVADEDTSLMEAAIQGQSFFAASGDEGSAECSYTAQYNVLPVVATTLAVQDPSSQPFATGVGGTTMGNGTGPSGLTTPADGSYAPESVWNNGDTCGDGSQSLSCASATGGGPSQTWPMPSYQSGAPASLGVGAGGATDCGSAANQPCREVPDVAADSDPLSGYLFYVTPGSGAGCPNAADTSCWIPIGGTSAAAPLWAAFTALADASSTCRGFSLGFENPSLYWIAGGSLYATDLHDIAAGSAITGQGNNDPYYNDPLNDVNDPSHLYPVTAGYDMTTGLGSLQGAALGNAVCGLRAPVYKVTVTSPGTKTSVVHKSVSVTIRAADSGNAKLQYRASGLPGGLSISPSSGVISGRPSHTGRSRVTVTAGDAYANSASVSFTWKIVKPGRPRVTGASLKGAVAGHPKLSFTLHQGSHAPRLHSVTVWLPRGLAFRPSLRHGITVRNGGHRQRFSARVSHGRLTVTLRRGQTRATVTVTAVRGTHHGRLSGRMTITDSSRHRTRLKVRFKG